MKKIKTRIKSNIYPPFHSCSISTEQKGGINKIIGDYEFLWGYSFWNSEILFTIKDKIKDFTINLSSYRFNKLMNLFFKFSKNCDSIEDFDLKLDKIEKYLDEKYDNFKITKDFL